MHFFSHKSLQENIDYAFAISLRKVYDITTRQTQIYNKTDMVKS